MTEPDVHTLVGPYVLDALPDDERATFEQHLAYCTVCASEVNELREAAAKLAADAATPPPPALKANVMAAIDQVRQLPPVVPNDDSAVELGATASRRRYRKRSLLALAAAFVAVAASGGIAIDQYRDKTAVTQASDRVVSVLAEPDARTLHGSIAGGGQATVVASTSANAAVVVMGGLRTLPDNQTWQLWLIDSNQVAHSVGLADASNRRELTRVVPGINGKVAFGLTVEPAGGSAKPTLPAAALIAMT